MPCLNSAGFVEAASRSVLDQSFRNLELILVDNGSTDDTPKLIAALAAEDPRVVLTTCTETGTAATRNTGIALARNRYIAFLDSDDLWDHEKLERQIASMQTKGLAFSWSSYHVMSGAGDYIRTQFSPARVSYDDLLKKDAVIGCLTVVYDTAALGKVFMPRIEMRQDYLTWLTILKTCSEQGLATGGLETPHATYRVHRQSMTTRKLRAARYQWKAYRQHTGSGFLKSIYLMGKYLVNGIRDRL